MYTDTEIAALKTSGQVQTAVTATAPVSSNADVAASLALGQGATFNLWLTKALRKFYNFTRI